MLCGCYEELLQWNIGFRSILFCIFLFKNHRFTHSRSLQHSGDAASSQITSEFLANIRTMYDWLIDDFTSLYELQQKRCFTGTRMQRVCSVHKIIDHFRLIHWVAALARVLPTGVFWQMNMRHLLAGPLAVSLRYANQTHDCSTLLLLRPIPCLQATKLNSFRNVIIRTKLAPVSL